MGNKSFKGINFKKLVSTPSDFDFVKYRLKESPYLIVISTFHNDEPVEILLRGIRIYNKNNNSTIEFKITGNFKKNFNLYNELSKHKNNVFNNIQRELTI